MSPPPNLKQQNPHVVRALRQLTQHPEIPQDVSIDHTYPWHYRSPLHHRSSTAQQNLSNYPSTVMLQTRCQRVTTPTQSSTEFLKFAEQLYFGLYASRFQKPSVTKTVLCCSLLAILFLTLK